jgi:two-component system, response regulator RegA
VNTRVQHRWLIVDDDEAFSSALTRGLERRGDTVGVAHDARSALAQARSHPQRVVLDLRLGADSGLQVLPKLRAALPASHIVVLTGYASIATAVRAVKEGADHYLPKPVLLKELLAAFDGLDAEAADADSAEALQATMSPRRLEWEHIQRVLEEERGNVSSAARRLGMHRRTLQRKLAKHPVPR